MLEAEEKKYLQSVEIAKELLKQKDGDLQELREGYYRAIAYCLENGVSISALQSLGVAPELIKQIRTIWKIE